jgi:cyclopropane-fatty-acyl-phospholipid synthase
MKNKILKFLEKNKHGFIEITTPFGEVLKIGEKNSQSKSDIKIKDWAFLDLSLAQGDIGFGRAYIEGLFETSDIEQLLAYFVVNRADMESAIYGKKIIGWFFSIKNFFKQNSLRGSKKNIEFHYDLGNDFYSLWLDDSMTYSAGIFCSKNCLSSSQENKYQRIIECLNPNDKKILEIGCGWGGFMNYAEKQGFEIKGLTLSNEQKTFVDELVKKNNLKSKVAIQDYRKENGKYGNVVSIEMFEAVGRKYWSGYFAKIKQVLKENGKAVVQTITIDDDKFKEYLKTSDFIREFIFPGGVLPSKTIFKKLAEENGLKVVDEFSFGKCYAKTLRKWLVSFDEVYDKVKALGYDDKFIRKWRFYLAYCAVGFESENTDVVQFTLAINDK